MAKIQCKFCNKKFKSYIDAYRHICPKDPEAQKKLWRRNPGAKGVRNKSSRQHWETLLKADKNYPSRLSKESKRHREKIKEAKLEVSLKLNKAPRAKKK